MKQTIACVEYTARSSNNCLSNIHRARNREAEYDFRSLFFWSNFPLHIYLAYILRTASRKDILMRLAVTLSKGKNKVVSATQLLIISINMVGC